MIFINTRPVDENAQCERRPSKAPSHSGHGHPHDGSAHVLVSAKSFCSVFIFMGYWNSGAIQQLANKIHYQKTATN